MNKMTQKKISLDKKITSSKFSITKNFLYFLIVPAVIILVGIILLCTVGFNMGTDFTGASTFKVYINNVNDKNNLDSTIASYDLSDKGDYNQVYDKIKLVLENNGLTIESYRTSTMNIADYNVSGGQAVEVVYQNLSDDITLITAKNNDIRSSLITEFGYTNFSDCVSTVDYVPAESSFSWTIGIVAGIVFGYLLVSIYMAFRYNPNFFIVALLQIAVDLFMTLALIAICQLTINLSLGIVLFTTFVTSVLNLYYFYSKVTSNIKSGKFEKVKPSAIADATTKETTFKRGIIYIVLLLIAILFSALAVEGVREVALGIMISLIVTFFTSELLLPSFWSTVYRPKKKSNRQDKKIPN